MAWFESGRTADAEYSFTLTSHYAQPHTMSLGVLATVRLSDREKGSTPTKAAEPIFPNPSNNIDKHTWFKKCVYAASLSGYRYVTYNIMARDDGATTADRVFDNCINGRHDVDRLSFDRLFKTGDDQRKGAILLMHNGRSWTDAALPKVIRYIYSKGFIVRKLPDDL